MISRISRLSLLALLATIGCRCPLPGSPSSRAVKDGVAAAPLVHVGRLVDVYGLRTLEGRSTIELYRCDVLTRPSLVDDAGAGFTLLPCNPDSLHKRILIAADIDSAAFAGTLLQIEAGLAELGPVVPRDAARRVTWPANGVHLAAPEVQLREQDPDAPVVARLIERGDSVIIDPVLHGTEAARHGTAGSVGSVGMPESALRLSIGRGSIAITREFRARGLLPDAEPPRIIGEMIVHLERVGRLTDETSVLTLFLGGIRQALDRGDILRLHEPTTNRPLLALEVLADVPATSSGDGRRAHVRVHTERDAQGHDLLERLDPSNLPGFPSQGGAARDAFVVAHGPRITIVVPFEPSAGDDASNFVRIAARDIEDTEGNRRDVPPDASYELRFSTAIDPATLVNLMMFDADQSHQVPVRVFAIDATHRSFRAQPPLGLGLTPAMKKAILADREQSIAQRADYVFRVVGGEHGVHSQSGVPLADNLQLDFSLDPNAADNLVGFRVFSLPGK